MKKNGCVHFLELVQSWYKLVQLKGYDFADNGKFLTKDFAYSGRLSE